MAKDGKDRMQKVLSDYLAYQAAWSENSGYLVRDSKD
jgi:hypothetical protein